MHKQLLKQEWQFPVLLFGVAFISFSILVLEISIMRIASALFTYHYAFIAVSIAVLGMGIGGVFTSKLEPKITRRGITRVLAEASILFSLSIIMVTLSVLNLNTINLFIYSTLMFIPFVITGFMFAAVFKTFSHNSNLIYFFDLSGAAIGSLAAISLFNSLSVINTVLLVGIISSIGAIFFALLSKLKRTILVTFLMLLISSAVFMQYTVNSFEIQVRGDEKEIHFALDNVDMGARIIHSEWDAYSRTDLVELTVDPHVKIIFSDGSAATAMFRFDGDFNSSDTNVYQLKNSSAYFPFYFGDKEKVLVIGSGGGGDILNALMGGAKQIYAIEVNPKTVEIVRDYSDFNGGIYTQYGNVAVFIDEGRSFLRRSSMKFDIIMLNIPVSQTSQGLSGYALAENYLFTSNSFGDYLDHLTEHGRLVIVTHFRFEIYRLTAIALQVLGNIEESIGGSMEHIVITETSASHNPVFILKKSAFNQQEIADMKLKSLMLDFNPLYFPYTNPAYLDPILTQLANGTSLDSLISYFQIRHKYDVEPPSDDKPFFYKFEVGVPFPLAFLLLGTSFFCLLTFELYLRSFPSHKGKHERYLKFFHDYFSLLGVGFMLIEISLMQKLILFLGHPTLAMSIILFSLLISSGIGGLFSRRVVKDQVRRALTISLIIAVTIIVYVLLMLPMLNVLLGAELIVRGIVTLVFIFPLGFLMGIPFSSGMSILKKSSENRIPWMWCLNGLFSVLGSIIAIVAAMYYGFNAVLLSGAFIYFFIFLDGFMKLRD
jgi:spermidine synthase